MRPSRRAVLVCLLLACIFTGLRSSPVIAFETDPIFESMSCPSVPAAGHIEGVTIRCGSVVVPENRSDADTKSVRLAVAIFPAQGIRTRPPLMFVGGGPGTFVLEVFGPVISGSLAGDLVAGARTLGVSTRFPTAQTEIKQKGQI